ncbi:aminoacyl-tRNA hydrolase [Candidatus Shapirobacteria bacterium]|nr:aminoacyl-tRNA hydrolase [Candidatus Shapirobacteria bacterium]
MKLIIGLGNPDKEYSGTRHNIGHAIIDKLKELNLTGLKLDKNTGFMNEAGFSVQKVVNFYKVDLQDFYLVHDDLDLPVGEYRFQFDRGPAGHHGVESVVEQLGSQAFNRIRVGIGHPRHAEAFGGGGQMSVADYVLKPFTSDEKMIIKLTVDRILNELLPIINS